MFAALLGLRSGFRFPCLQTWLNLIVHARLCLREADLIHVGNLSHYHSSLDGVDL
jgi:hypothetical protein